MTFSRHDLIRLLGSLLFLGCCALAGVVEAQEAPAGPDPVESGRNGLRGGNFNWYDRATDDLRRIEVQPPPDTGNYTSGGGGGTGGGGVSGAGAGFVFEGLQVIVWLVIGVILATLVYFLIQAFLRREAVHDTKGTQQSVAEVDRTESLPIPIEKNISDLLAAARRAYEQGDYRMAIVYLYSHQLVELDKNQVIHLAKGKTNRQYLREVIRAGRKALGGVLEQTQVLFEEAFFGGRAIGPEQFAPCWASLPEFDRMVRENTR